MSRLVGAAFIFSIIGAAYQFISFGILALVEPNRNTFYYYFAFGTPAFLSLAIFWMASHLLQDHKVTWPAMIFAVGVADLANLIIVYSIPTSTGTGFPSNSSLSPTGLFILSLSPTLVLVGGILGIMASVQYSRQHNQTIIHPPTSSAAVNIHDLFGEYKFKNLRSLKKELREGWH